MLAAHIAQHVRERQGGLRAEVSVTARYPQTVTTPESGLQTQEIYTLFGTAVASLRGTRTLTGVQAQGMTACPCAQEMVAGLARERLACSGFDAEQVERRSRRCRSRPTTSAASAPCTSAARGGPELDRRPGAAADRRDLDELGDLRADEAPDELAVVERPTPNPRFVEDCVREMLRQVVEGYPDLPGEAS